MNILQKIAITAALLATAPMAWADVY